MLRRSLIVALVITLIVVAWLYRAQEDTPDARVIPMNDQLRLRTRPALTSDTLDLLMPATPLMLVGRTADSAWLQVRPPGGKVGWVKGEFVEFALALEDVPVMRDLDLPVPTSSLTASVIENLQRIYQSGQQRGNRGDVFSQVGDSITAAPFMFQPIAQGMYYLGDYQYLQAVIDHFGVGDARDGHSSFTYAPLAAANGWSTPVVLDPKYADPTACQPGESPLACEYRVVRPSMALILFGTNDVGLIDDDSYGYHLRLIIELSIQQGIIPVVSTIPVRTGYEDKVAAFNEKVIMLTRRFEIPLWDYAAALQNLPAQGMSPDGVHPSAPPLGYEGSVDFHLSDLQSGFVVRNLTALQMLDAVWRAVGE
jgi:hypothetical protein